MYNHTASVANKGVKIPRSYGGAEAEVQRRATLVRDTAMLHRSVRWPQNLTWDWQEPDRRKRDVNPQRLMGRGGTRPNSLLPLLSEKLSDPDHGKQVEDLA